MEEARSKLHVSFIPTVEFSPEELRLIHKDDVKLLKNVRRLGTELCMKAPMSTDPENDMEVDFSIDQAERKYVYLFLYPPSIREMTMADTGVFASLGLATGQTSVTQIVTGLETHYTDADTGEVRTYDKPRYFVRVNVLMADNPNLAQHNIKVILEESVQVIPRSANRGDTMVYRMREGTAFAQSGSPRTKKRAHDSVAALTSSPSTRNGSPSKRMRPNQTSSSSSFFYAPRFPVSQPSSSYDQ